LSPPLTIRFEASPVLFSQGLYVGEPSGKPECFKGLDSVAAGALAAGVAAAGLLAVGEATEDGSVEARAGGVGWDALGVGRVAERWGSVGRMRDMGGSSEGTVG
jgi:hypothetical protein